MLTKNTHGKMPVVVGSQSAYSSLGDRLARYSIINFLFTVLVVSAALLGDAGKPSSISYLILLFAVCTSPVIFADKASGKYAILVVFLPLYLMFYGLTDFMSLFSMLDAHNPGGGWGLLESEVSIIVGALVLIIGFLFGVVLVSKKEPELLNNDWPKNTTLFIGLIFWLGGMYGTWVWQLNFSDTRVNADIGAVSGTVFTLLRMAHPMGTALIVYSYVTSKQKYLLLLMIGVFASEFALGFVADSKELSIRAPIILILTKWLIDGRVPRKWIILFGALILFTFSIFQAYRLEVLQIRDQSRSEAMANFSQNIDKALESKILKEGKVASSLSAFSSRINLKPTMELIVEGTGKDVLYQGGYTLKLLLYALIPRIVWPDKPDSSVGQLFNREFKVSQDADTYISATHLGELYWNYGWPGLIFGMMFIGFIFGIVSARCMVTENPNVTRYLILISTIYLLCFRFEGGIALQYTLWIRSIFVILLLHFLFSRVNATKE